MQASPLHARIVEKGDNLTVYLQVGPKGRVEPTRIEGKRLSFWGKVWNFFFRNFVPVKIESRDVFLSKTSLKKNLSYASSRSFTRDPKVNADKISRYILEEHFKTNPLMANGLKNNIQYRPLLNARRGRYMPKDSSENPLLFAKKPKETPRAAEPKRPLLPYSRIREKKASSKEISEEPKPVRRSPSSSRSSPSKERVSSERTPLISKSSNEPQPIQLSGKNSPIGREQVFKVHIQRLEQALRSTPFLDHVLVQDILKLEDEMLPYRELKDIIRHICKIPAEIRFAPDMRKACKELLSKMRQEEAKPTTTEDQKAVFLILRETILEKLSKA